MDRYDEEGVKGLIEYVDKPATVAAMYAHVRATIGRVHQELKGRQFALLKFTKPAEPGEIALPDDGEWFPALDRSATSFVNLWHTHQGVVVFSPEQAEADVPTGVSTLHNYHQAKKATGIDTLSPDDPEAIVTFNNAMPAFWTNKVSESGHVLIVPENELHARGTRATGKTKQAGNLERMWLKDVV